MLCANCESSITGYHYRAGMNGCTYCSKFCCYEAYEGFYTKQEVNKTVKEIKIAPKCANTSRAKGKLTI